MAQKILKDSGLLIDEGRSQSSFESDVDWDPAFYEVVDTGQVFEPLDVPPEGPPTGPATGRSPKRQTWFYLPSRNLFFENTRRSHAIFAAAKSIFTPERWDEIEDALDEYGPIRDLLNRMDMTRLRRKVQKARAAGLITVAEAQALADLVDHLPN
jgi:hypothetical protein